MLNAERKPVTGKRVQLMATCLCDAFYADVAKATVEVLEHAGCTIDFPEGQTCCGQPAFNGGDWTASRKVVRHTLRTFTGDDPVILPSGSCAAMLFHGAPLAFEKEPDLAQVEALGRRTWELVDFLVHGLGIKAWPGRFDAKVALHRPCHTRGTGSTAAALTLLGSIKGIEVVEFGELEQCCGFGGTFSVKFGDISARICDQKCDDVQSTGTDAVVLGDLGCMLNIEGRMRRRGDVRTRVLHVAEVLAGTTGEEG